MMKIKKMIIFMYVYIYRCHFGTQFFDNMDERKRNRAGYKQRLRCARKEGEKSALYEINETRFERVDTFNRNLERVRELTDVKQQLTYTIIKLEAEALNDSEKQSLKDSLHDTTVALSNQEEELAQLEEQLRVLVGGRPEKGDFGPECPVCFERATWVRECGHMFCGGCKSEGRGKCEVCRREKPFLPKPLIL